MTVPPPWRQQIMAALSWYGGQVRAVAAEAVHPLRRTVHVVVDDSVPSVVELVATQEQLLLGVPADATAGGPGPDARPAA